jgi:UrcA family protein
MKSRFYLLAVLAGVLGGFISHAALADEAVTKQVSTGNIAVSYADLNLASTSGLDLLYRRVKLAAHKVCAVDRMRVPLDIERKNRACVAGAIDSAIGEIDNPRLTALHQARLLEATQS